VIIGAGFGGIGMAIALKKAGFGDFVLLEKSDDLGDGQVASSTGPATAGLAGPPTSLRRDGLTGPAC